MRSFSRRAYDNGIVIVECPRCNGRHLVADRLGWFGQPGSVEDYLEQRGEGRLPVYLAAVTLAVTDARAEVSCICLPSDLTIREQQA